MAGLAAQLREFIVENFLFGQGNGNLTDDASLMDNGIVDSTGVLELIAHIEETYGIQVQDDELVPENLDSISNLVRYIESKNAVI